MKTPLNVEQVARFLWGAVLLTLPVTSFRYFPLAGEGTLVRPLAFYPLILLMFVLFIQLLRGRTRFPWVGTLTPLAGFLLVALAASVIGILHAPIELRGQSILGRELRAWATLVIGSVFFIAAVWMNRDGSDLRFTVKWLLAGFAINVLWSGVQAVTFYTGLLEKEMVTRWQLVFSMRELVRANRVSGLAYEPAWLAGQIATLYMPWLFASLLTGQRLTRFRWLEPTLLGFALILVLATYSRGGLLDVGGAAALTFLFAGRKYLRAAWDWFISGFRRGGRGWIPRVGVSLAAVAAFAGALIFLGQKGYISRLWNSEAENLQEFVVENSAGARAAYTAGAMAAYETYPWTGVGLGASGFYIYQNLPDWSLTTVPEIARQLSPENRLYPNPKNLYVRLLSETGLIGFALFIAFEFAVLGEAVFALQRKSPSWQYLGIAGLFSWLALLFYNITQDSFATPNLWINFGMLVGISAFAVQSGKISEEIV